ncbi:MAG: MBL fold metallo-hydrolase, partial [Candidatus Moranbacteria bacterium]|nr:MBL fold metallo-hydrolase [Candidatus Moranbacteria bacterium]
NTIFILETEDMKLCHMGDIGTELTPEQIERAGEVDILIIPIGGKYTIDGKTAVRIAQKLEPAIIIPMHYKMGGLKIDVSDEKEFCSEIGGCPKEKINKITLKKKDLEDKNMDVLLMRA